MQEQRELQQVTVTACVLRRNATLQHPAVAGALRTVAYVVVLLVVV